MYSGALDGDAAQWEGWGGVQWRIDRAVFIFPEYRVAIMRSGLPPTPPDIDYSSHVSFTEMTTSFPLLRLPRLALICVFEQMEEREIIKFSLLSKRAHNLSKSLRKLSASFIYLVVESDHLDIRVIFEMYREVELSYYFNSENPPNSTHGNIGLTASQWLERVLDVTNCESLRRVDINGVPALNMCDALSSLKNIREIFIGVCCPHSFAKKALEILSPVSTKITMTEIPFESREDFRTFLMKNLNFLDVDTHGFSRFALDDLLVTNALKVRLRGFKFSARVVRQFLTNWFQSKCNSRLEHLKLRIAGVFNETRIPEVLNAVPFPRDQERTFLYSKQLDTPSKTLRGGYDIERADGKKATILFGTNYGRRFFDFYVWP